MITTTSNLWRAYSTNDLTVNKLTMKPEEDALECIFLEFEDSKLCTMSATEYAVVCLVSKDGAMEMGMLKLRTAALQRQVNALLQPIVTE
ncbi:hypothetical protein AGDE_02819 [Angomonas deanei]|uniref:Roadblock/LC7 domain containing protein n=1 Tax=Angomonas deanei TaxID=59799 RepID=A0A7G2CC07_9TRYP|nr:hypothetical protein AGDE_02819 [Angomonas deanei]CAD2216561.1 hypothetical protein, conserved [Angomonas deanei]|eukprot:EPY41106.1 hypothetical protein AGDE_02819 [Angomonas deanei]